MQGVVGESEVQQCVVETMCVCVHDLVCDYEWPCMGLCVNLVVTVHSLVCVVFPCMCCCPAKPSFKLRLGAPAPALEEPQPASDGEADEDAVDDKDDSDDGVKVRSDRFPLLYDVC